MIDLADRLVVAKSEETLEAAVGRPLEGHWTCATRYTGAWFRATDIVQDRLRWALSGHFVLREVGRGEIGRPKYLKRLVARGGSVREAN